MIEADRDARQFLEDYHQEADSPCEDCTDEYLCEFHDPLVRLYSSPSAAQLPLCSSGVTTLPTTTRAQAHFNYIEHTPRVSMTVERFVDYWGKVPNVDQYISFPIPEQSTRVAALLNSEVDWIEVPASDAIPRMLEAGMILSAEKRAHWWPYQINMHKAPWDDVRVRKALNYAIDRETLCRDILNGICVPAAGVTYPGHPHFGNPEEIYTYDPEKAKALLAEAGVELPVKFHLLTSTSGSGQMSPIIMNEFIQRNVAESGFEMTMEFVEWNTFQERTWVRLAPGGR